MADPPAPAAPALCCVAPEGPVYRIARAPTPWAWPDWAHAGQDGTFGNRWDDPGGVYRVLYASSSRLGAFVEVLSRFRPDLELLQELAEIEGDGEALELPGELDAAAVRLSAPRRFTQEVSRYVYERSTPSGARRYAGIAYGSKLGDEFRNWALFEPAGGEPALTEEGAPRPIDADDPDLRRALELLGVRLVGR